MNFFTNKYARILTVALIVQIFAFYALAMRPERVPVVGPLADFPTTFDHWSAWRDFPLDADTQAVLKADDVLNRFYLDPAQTRTCLAEPGASDSANCLNLFIAFFKTQRYGQSPHSPKNCLPGAGWEQVSAERPAIQVPGEDHPIIINNFVTEHGDQKSVSLYWYQSHQRIIASEFGAKFYSMVDSVRYHRSDTAIVRVTIPVDNGNIDAAVQKGYSFVRAIFPALLRQLPQ
jgi:EpsI family protein